MKKITLIIGMLIGLTSMTYAQGTLNFANFASGVNAPVTNSGSVLASGSNYVADLFWGTSVGTVTNDLGLRINFQTGAGSGYFLGGSQTLPTTGTVDIMVAVYSGSFANFAAAQVGQGAEYGTSGIIAVALAVSPTPAPPLTGLQGFGLTLNPVPEPSTIALGGLGVASLLLFRRKK